MTSNTPMDERRPLLSERQNIHQTSSSSSRNISFPSRSQTAPSTSPSAPSALNDVSVTSSTAAKKTLQRPNKPSRLTSFPPSHDPYPTSNPIPSPSDFSSSGLSSAGSDFSDWDDDVASVRNGDGKSDVNKPSVLHKARPHHHKHHHHHHHHKDKSSQQNGPPRQWAKSWNQDEDDMAEYGVRHRASVNGDIPAHWVRKDGLPKFSRDCLWR